MRAKWAVILMVMLALSVVAVGRSQAAEPALTQVNVISAPFGTASYVFSTTLEEIAKKAKCAITISASESPGIIYNIKKLNQDPEMKKNTIMTYSNASGWMAANGEKPFEKKYPYPKLIANYALTCLWLATLDPDIKGPEQLVGKKIALGRAPQPVWGKVPALLVNQGWDLKGKVKLEFVGTKEAVGALVDGLADAAIVGGFVDPIHGKVVPGPTTIELMAAGKQVNNLSWGKAAVDKLISTGIPLAQAVIPANTLQGQTQALEVASDPISWVAYPEFPEEAAYIITKMIIENVDMFKKYHNLGELVSKEALVYSWNPKDIHPGALRAYKEAGIIK